MYEPRRGKTIQVWQNWPKGKEGKFPMSGLNKKRTMVAGNANCF